MGLDSFFLVSDAVSEPLAGSIFCSPSVQL
jgi:hypothetical protein